MAGSCWRSVEAQHRVSTMKLVDTLAEQRALEDLLESTKPPVPFDCRHLHYLLSTPFRYGAPYPSGSRFRRAGFTPGVYYGSSRAETAVGEMAFHRLLFFADSPDTPWPSNAGEHTVFSTRFRTPSGLNLTTAPFSVDHDDWTNRTNYAACQNLAEAAREADVDVVKYPSARLANGINLAILRCRTFASREPIERQTWRLQIGVSGARALCDFPSATLEFDRDSFAADPRIANLAWDRPAVRSKSDPF